MASRPGLLRAGGWGGVIEALADGAWRAACRALFFASCAGGDELAARCSWPCNSQAAAPRPASRTNGAAPAGTDDRASQAHWSRRLRSGLEVGRRCCWPPTQPGPGREAECLAWIKLRAGFCAAQLRFGCRRCRRPRLARVATGTNRCVSTARAGGTRLPARRPVTGGHEAPASNSGSSGRRKPRFRARSIPATGQGVAQENSREQARPTSGTGRAACPIRGHGLAAFATPLRSARCGRPGRRHAATTHHARFGRDQGAAGGRAPWASNSRGGCPLSNIEQGTATRAGPCPCCRTRLVRLWMPESQFAAGSIPPPQALRQRSRKGCGAV